MPATWPGRPSPLGATWDGVGVNFALFSANATGVELCLFDPLEHRHEQDRIWMTERTDDVWHVYVPGLKPRQPYAYRVHGPYKPEVGLRFNPHKLLIDPYARAISGAIAWDDTPFGYGIGDPLGDVSFDMRDSAHALPRGIVVDDAFPWGNDRPLGIPLHRSIIYEVHVKGFTQRHPDVPAPVRGTYAGLASPPSIDYLTRLGVTAVELLPVHHRVDDRLLADRGLTNYWGYNSFNFFAPDSRYARPDQPGDQVREFKSMVKRLHAAGIEVILDVVYNHTPEGNHLGPTLSLRGIDNPSYYRLVPDNPRYYMDYTGCGNSTNTLHARMLQMVMDSLRYWVTEMHVDGFRFDLAATLTRGQHEDDRLSSFFDLIHQDPVLSQTKLIAEPWDIGPNGYQVGNFPVLWSEWNGRYRDTVRRFWSGDDGQVAELAYRLAGSSDLYQHNGRRPYASINFVTAHDGFTLRDLVSYNEKHNEANGEGNQDGDNHNNSWNCGVEGPTDDPRINALRERQMRNMLATLLLSQGVPMLLAGDELGRTQHGNNNAYCQDNELSWVDWEIDSSGERLLAFVRWLIGLRHRHPVLRRRNFFRGSHGGTAHDILWWRPDGIEMGAEDWENGLVRCIGMLLNGQELADQDERGQPICDDTLLLMLNAHNETIPFTVPGHKKDPLWEMLVDTTLPTTDYDELERLIVRSGDRYRLQGHSLVLLQQRARR